MAVKLDCVTLDLPMEGVRDGLKQEFQQRGYIEQVFCDGCDKPPQLIYLSPTQLQAQLRQTEDQRTNLLEENAVLRYKLQAANGDTEEVQRRSEHENGVNSKNNQELQRLLINHY